MQMEEAEMLGKRAQKASSSTSMMDDGRVNDEVKTAAPQREREGRELPLIGVSRLRSRTRGSGLTSTRPAAHHGKPIKRVAKTWA